MRISGARMVLVVVTLLFVACGGGSNGGTSDAGPDGGPTSDVPTTDTPGPSGTASLVAKVKIVKNFPLQVVDLLKQYLTADKIFKGDLYLQLCEDQDCTKVVATKQVLQGELFSTGFYKDIQVSGLPAGTFYARFAIDTLYSQEYGSSFQEDGTFGPMDIVQTVDGAPSPTPGSNPPAGTVEVTLVDGQSTDIGSHELGTLLFEDPSFPPSTEDGFLLVAASGKDVYRNQIRVVDLSTYTVSKSITLERDGNQFAGDICGFVRGQGDVLYVVAVGAAGAYVFAFDTKNLSFVTGSPVLIPHPDYDGGDTTNLDPEKYPWPCRGVSITKSGKEFLYLIAFKGAGSLTNSAPYPLVVVDVTGLASGQGGQLVETYDDTVDQFFDTSRIIRGAATDGDKLYLLEASWSKLVDKNTVYAFTVGDDGRVTKDSLEIQSGTADDNCDSTNNWVPAIAVVDFGGQKVITVGNDEGIGIYGLDGSKLSWIDTTAYGRLITSFALSPDGKVLYAMPNCKSAAKKASVKAGVSDKRVDLDRHAIVAIDLTSNPSDPVLLYGDRDFDEDGNPDGGIDLEFLYLKRSLLRWCETCTGVVPPTAYTGPEIAVGQRSVFLRGTGIQSDEKNSSGLGQLADIGVFDIDSGKGVIFRDYNIWLDGPSSRWGFDLNPDDPTKDYQDDQSTAALIYVPNK